MPDRRITGRATTIPTRAANTTASTSPSGDPPTPWWATAMAPTAPKLSWASEI